MRLTTRTCSDCSSKFDLIEDKYFYKKQSRLKNLLEISIKNIIFTIRNKRIFLFEQKLICESCNRENKIKNLGI